MEILKHFRNVVAPGGTTGLDMYVIDRGNGREVIHTCYIESVLEEYIDRGLVTAYPVPEEMRDDALPYHPEVWTNPKPVVSAA